MKKTLITLSFLLIGLIGMAQTKDSVKVQPKVELEKPSVVILQPELSLQIIEVLKAAHDTILKSSNSNTTEYNLSIMDNIKKIIQEFNKQLPKKEGK